MKMVLTGLRKLQKVEDKPAQAAINPDDILVDVVCCAICRTDAKMWDQGHRDLVFPRVLGHEMVVKDKSGQHYAVWPGKSCGVCRFCISGRENLCEHMEITGFHHDGGFADQAVLPKKSLVPIPDTMDPFLACFAEPVACVINAFEKLDTMPGQRLLIYGAGTMGLVTAFYAKNKGLRVHLLEKNQTKIDHIQPVLDALELACTKETLDSEYDLVINCCADFIAFAQAITKVDKAGQISFFSGISKNETIETNLLNLFHYKEAAIVGAYGMTSAHIRQAVTFIETHGAQLKLLIEDVLPLFKMPELLPLVLSGNHLKYILKIDTTCHDFKRASDTEKCVQQPSTLDDQRPDQVPDQRPDHPPAPDSKALSLFQTIQNQIHPVSENLRAAATEKIDEKTKPLGALGRLEALAIQMCMIQESLTPRLSGKSLFVFAADHGVTEEGVSAYPSEVTGQMVDNFLNGGAAINVLCRHHSIDMKVVDMGVKTDFCPHPNLIDKKIAHGTHNFALEPAMSRHQAVAALESGISVFLDAYENNPVDIVGLGEMGIGNTTSAAAIICAITGLTPDQATGRGTGVDDKGLAHKTKVIKKVLAFHTLDPEDGLDILQRIGGFEIAGIAGAVLAAASKRTAVVLDGVISTAAGLIACLINPDVRGFLISGHRSVEISQKAALKHMNLEPLIDLNMRLGEGTGAALAMDMADAACKIMSEMASFDDARIARSL